MSVSDETIALLRNLNTPTLSNALEDLGISGVIEGLSPAGTGLRCTGRAVTVQETTGPRGAFPASDFRVGEMIDAAGAGDVIVVANGGAPVSTWGGTASYAAHLKGVAGLVVDGGIRDREEICEIGFPAFARHMIPTTGKTRIRVEAIGEPIICSGIPVNNGDAIVADGTGIVCIPAAAAAEVAEMATRYAADDAEAMRELERGLTFREAMARFAKDMIAREILARLKDAAGADGYIDDPAGIAPYCTPFRDGWVGETPLVLRPDTAERVAGLVRICAETGTPIVPQGGNTGLTGASQPHLGGNEVILSTGRMNRIRGIDPLNDTITVEAGVVLADVRRAAEGVDRLFPLSLGAEGSCQTGGNLSTNAGGVHVLRYGNARSLVLGLEVVTGDGVVWDGLRALRKDNAGYDLKHLFIGAEGTLGIITAAVLRLFPRPRDRQTALVAVSGPQAAVELLARLRGAFGAAVSAFELMHGNCFALAAKTHGHGDPLAGEPPWRVLLDLTGQGAPGGLLEPLEAALADALEAGCVTDAVVARSGDQASRLWKIREDQAEVQRRAGTGIKHDVSVPVSRVPAFLARADAAMARAYPGHVTCTFGHLGDGNVHYNPIEPPGWETARWLAETGTVNRIVHDIVADLGGSITAEHGVGRLRMAELVHYKPPVEIELMRRLKRSFDPANILNPGKVLLPEGEDAG